MPRINSIWLCYIILLIYCWIQFARNQNSMVQEQRHRSTEQNRKLRNKPVHYGQLIYNKGGKNIQWRKDSLFHKWFWETGYLHVKEIRIFSNTIYKSQHKMNWRPKYKAGYYKTPREKHKQNTLWHKSQQNFFQTHVLE